MRKVTGWNVSTTEEKCVGNFHRQLKSHFPATASDDPQLPSFRPNRQRLNKLLANYLRRDEDPDEGPYDPYELEARKRSIFRERDGEY